MRFPFLFSRDTTPTDPIFFYSTTPDTCDYGGQNFPATNNSANGDLCARIPGTNFLYACPAPDSVCWSFARDCNGGNSTNPGPDRISCSNNGPQTWCCDETYDSCTETYGQINVCWGKTFSNPNKGVSPSAAASIASSAVSASQASALNSRLSAISATDSSSTLTGTQTGPISTSTSSSQSQPSNKSDSLSGGAIAGIVVGVIIGAIIFVLLTLFLLRRHRARRQLAVPPNMYEAGGNQFHPEYYPAEVSADKKVSSPVGPIAELPGSDAAAEMPNERK